MAAAAAVVVARKVCGLVLAVGLVGLATKVWARHHQAWWGLAVVMSGVAVAAAVHTSVMDRNHTVNQVWTLQRGFLSSWVDLALVTRSAHSLRWCVGRVLHVVLSHHLAGPRRLAWAVAQSTRPLACRVECLRSQRPPRCSKCNTHAHLGRCPVGAVGGVRRDHLVLGTMPPLSTCKGSSTSCHSTLRVVAQSFHRAAVAPLDLWKPKEGCALMQPGPTSHCVLPRSLVAQLRPWCRPPLCHGTYRPLRRQTHSDTMRQRLHDQWMHSRLTFLPPSKTSRQPPEKRNVKLK